MLETNLPVQPVVLSFNLLLRSHTDSEVGSRKLKGPIARQTNAELRWQRIPVDSYDSVSNPCGSDGL